MTNEPTIPETIVKTLDHSPKVIWNWRDAWKMHSVRVNAVGALFNIICAAAVQSFMAAPLIVLWPIRIVLILGAVLFILGILGRMMTQKDMDINPDGR